MKDSKNNNMSLPVINGTKAKKKKKSLKKKFERNCGKKFEKNL